MSSLNHCIKFKLDIKDENIVFKDYFYKSIKLQNHKIIKSMKLNWFSLLVLIVAPWLSCIIDIWLPTFAI